MTKYRFEVTVDSDMFYGGMVADLQDAMKYLQDRHSINKVVRLRVIEKV